MTPRIGLWQGFFLSAERFPHRPAILTDGEELSYQELRESACRIAATIQAYPEFSRPALTSVFAYRSITAFTGVLGALLAGNGYVPLNRTFPPERTQLMFARAGSRSIVVDHQSLPQLEQLLDRAEDSVLAILPEIDDVSELRAKEPKHVVLGALDLEPASAWHEPAPNLDEIAYLLFTSGSTGLPKGVMVAVRNVLAFVNYMVERYEITETDRFSQMFDMTFDLSAFDMFVCWERGALLCCPPQKALMNPGKFIRENQLTVWFSVPSTAVFMKRLGVLKRDRYPSLRLSLFCGEPLPVSSIIAWAEAAPNTIIENLYGPTELTIACTLYRWDPLRSPGEAELGIVPIGFPYPGMQTLVVNEALEEVERGQEGELLMNGPQMSLGYWKDPVKTAAAFVVPVGKTEVFYRTGDRVRRPHNDGPLTHLGRVDFQVKILGHRVELGEVEAKVREACGLDGVVALGWPRNDSGFGGIEVFVEGASIDKEWLRKEVSKGLPDYMVPGRFHFLEKLPRNANGKYDRTGMKRLLELSAEPCSPEVRNVNTSAGLKTC
jgi:amino acid adenylation domain-containing protein